MHLGVGDGGWVRVEDPDRLPGPLYARLRRADDGRWRVFEIYLDAGDSPISGEITRRLPISQIETVAADPDLSRAIEERMKWQGVPLDVLASHYATTFTTKERSWVADAYHSQFSDRGVDRVEKHEEQRKPGIERPPLQAPEGGQLTDDFLRQVHRAYTAAVARGEWPAPSLAEQTGASVHAVRKWIYTARRRGIMPQGRQGALG